MTGKEKFLYWILIPLAAAFIAGPLALYLGKSDWTIPAREHGWVPLEELDEDFVALEITSPGQGAEIPFDFQHRLSAKIVVTSSKPLKEKHSLGFVYRYGKAKNLNAVFPEKIGVNEVKTIYAFPSNTLFVEGAYQKHGYDITMWAILVRDKLAIGEYFKNIKQIHEQDQVVSTSAPVKYETR